MARTKGVFRDPTSKTGYSALASDGRYKDIRPEPGQRLIANPFSEGRLQRNARQRPSARPKKGYNWQYAGGKWVQQKQAAQPAKPKTVDPRDSQYMSDFGQAQYDRSQAITGIEQERAQLPALYQRNIADLNKQLDRSRYDSNAELAARGIFRSGERGNRAIQHQDTYQRGRVGVEQQYGSGRQAELSQRLASINDQYRLTQADLMRQARERYMQQNPASRYIWQSLGG